MFWKVGFVEPIIPYNYWGYLKDDLRLYSVKFRYSPYRPSVYEIGKINEGDKPDYRGIRTRKRREGEKQEWESEDDASLYFATYEYLSGWYLGYDKYLEKISNDSKAEGEFIANAWWYYRKYGFWPAWYNGYYYWG